MADLISRAAAIKTAAKGIWEWMGFHSAEMDIYLEKKIDALPAVDAIPVEWMRDKMRGYASALKSTETAALVRVMQMWEEEQEAR